MTTLQAPTSDLAQRVETALDSLRAGRPVLVTDAADRENEGDVVLAAELASAQWVGWAVRHTSGMLCVPMSAERAAALDLPRMVERNEDLLLTDYTVSCDAASGVTTGISAHDRARAAQVLADPASAPGDLIRPGHVFPLRARPGGVLERPGHTEAAVDLCRLAGLAPVGLISEIVEDDGSLSRWEQIVELGRCHDVPVLTIADLATYLSTEQIPTKQIATNHQEDQA
ncbi:MAG: 3,4-dihydroxy-2-butanone-4-phosphate synthase [Janthinobacterium lividum]